MKENKVIIVLVILVIVLFGILGYKMLKPNNEVEQISKENNNAVQEFNKEATNTETKNNETNKDEIKETENKKDNVKEETSKSNVIKEENEEQSKDKEIYDSSKNTIEQSTSNIKDAAAEAFNANFTLYEGTGMSGARVKMLKQVVQSSNATNPEHQVKLNSVEINTSNKYTVKLSYDKQGYVNKIDVY